MDGLAADSVSTALRQAREQRGVSVPDAARAANIPLSYLRALEAGGDYRLLVDPMYLIPFLRTYAVYLGLGPDDAVRQFVAELQRTAVSTARNPPDTPLSLLRPAQLSAWIVPLVVLVGGLVGVGLVVQSIEPPAWRAEEEEPAGGSVVAEAKPAEPAPSGERPPVPSPATERQHTEELADNSSGAEQEAAPVAPAPGGERPIALPPVTEQEPRVEISQTPEPAPLASELPEPTGQTAPAPPRLHRLHIRALETTWLHVVIDGGLPREVLLQPGDHLRWEASRHFILTVGNAGGVELTFDDNPLRRLGGSGEVVRELRLPALETP